MCLCIASQREGALKSTGRCPLYDSLAHCPTRAAFLRGHECRTDPGWPVAIAVCSVARRQRHTAADVEIGAVDVGTWTCRCGALRGGYALRFARYQRGPWLEHERRRQVGRSGGGT